MTDSGSLGGDFNVIKDRRERKGNVEVVRNNKVTFFAEFIEKSSFVDIPCKGTKFCGIVEMKS